MKFSRRTALITVSAVACLSAAAVYVFAVSGSDDESVAVPVPNARVTAYCEALHARLPKKVDGLSGHDLKPASPLTAGWGDPTIVLRCGVPRPAEDDDVNTPGAEVGGVGWSFEQQSDGGARLTTTLRKAYVELTLPPKYAHDATPLTELAAAVKATIPAGI
ncbi:Protein of unknown function [Actinacidiphila yanglinensis]|uniref:DUF3515 domain-containing protein n=1 Tax=Actinacidiphila yanglinensis TaxID=310779 RepID=A0A1H6E482_9ACTN|nr:DUF3515 domain-containing protein [Actinacidiphila yanglinensis]SEG92538.1 Protein of unknown function [Actinacidiphila yanglinensis]